tara:strand:+ start:593 stop:1507 length:915 start_codon:yes stop_codon:yes gene_type:complete
MFNSWHVIANGFSNSGKTKESISKIESLLNKSSIKYIINFTKKAGDEIEMVETATKKGYHKIIGIGGDGTAQKIVAGIMMQKNIPNNEVLFALIPSGTGNDWAKSKGIPLDYSDSIKVIKANEEKFQDVGVAKIINGKNLKTKYFITYSGVGFDSFMLKKIENYKWLGKLSYLFCALMNFMSYENIGVEIETSNSKIKTKVFLLGIGICKFTGGGMQLIKNPAGNNGLLNVTIAQEFSKFDVIRNFFNLFNGALFKEPKVLTLTDSKIKMRAKKGLLTCQGDGEIFGEGKIEYFVVKKGLRYLN